MKNEQHKLVEKELEAEGMKHKEMDIKNLKRIMNIYFLYLTCSLRFLSRRKKEKRRKTKKEDEKLYIAENIYI